MMDQLGQQSAKFSHSKSWSSRSRNSNSALAFGGSTPAATAATEEWTGAGAPLTKTITVS
jgi:hypothetical protein